MCGIFVVIPKKNNVNLEKAKESLIKLKNRGPDYSFYKIIENVFFGQTVLSMSGKFKRNINDNFSKSKNFFIVYNGEIYNYKNLSKTLLEEKHKIFSDTQVLVNLFEKYSSENIHKYLDGMYAYVLYDKKNNKILISRDPQGEKSLYKYEDSKQIILSSEISPILHYIKEKELNLNVLKTYFLSRHFIQFDKTIYKNIQNIEPGQVIEVNLKNYKIKQLSSVSISYLINEDLYRKNSLKKEEELLEELDFLFKKNIQEMIPQKRNFTSIVSGGIDSTLISYYLDRYSNPKKIFSINHLGKDYISNKIILFNRFFSKKITSIEINKFDYFKYLNESTKICCSPISSHDFVGKLLLAKKTKENNCKAIFGGDGADEYFGGYETYSQKIYNNNNCSDYTKILHNKYLNNNEELIYFKKKMKQKWTDSKESYAFISNKSERIKLSMMLIDSMVQLPSVGLRGTDLMSMSQSVEPRSLFLRKDLITFALNLPIKFKIMKKKNKIINKYLLKKLFEKKFNKKLIFKKQGFSGFPNEIKEFLPPRKNFLLKKYDKSLSKMLFSKIGKSLEWKVLNTEYFLRTTVK